MARLQDILDNLLAQYEGYFNIERPHSFAGEAIPAFAHYTQRISKYVLVKRAQIYATETHEYVFFVSREHLDMEAWEFEKKRIIQAENDYVQPHQEHMYSYVTLVLLCETIDADVKREMRKLRFTKNYKFAVQGYSTVRLAAIELSTEEILTNARGKELKQVLSTALHM